MTAIPVSAKRSDKWSNQKALGALSASELVAFAVLDGDEILYGSPRLGKILLWDPPRSAIPDTLPDLICDADRARVLAAIASATQRFRDICSLIRADGSEVPVVLDVARIAFGDSRRTVLVATEGAVSTQNHARLRRLAFRDALTGLPNRALLCDRLDQAIAAAKRESATVIVMLIDLDRFKPINDALGHAAGDRAICEAARRLAISTRPEDTVARLGGDEFVVLLGGKASRAEAAVVAARIIRAFAVPLPGQYWSIGVSIGIALYPEDGRDRDQLLAQADGAMYAAKAAGGNRHAYVTRQKPGAHVPMRLAWSADQMIGIDRIDAEHARLVEEMNALSQALCADHGHAALEHRMRQMAGLLEHHFATEEAHMLAHPYSGAAEHRAEHQRVMEVVQGLTAHVSSESVALGIRFLYDWLLRHIRTYDRELPRGTVDETRRDVGPG